MDPFLKEEELFELILKILDIYGEDIEYRNKFDKILSTVLNFNESNFKAKD